MHGESSQLGRTPPAPTTVPPAPPRLRKGARIKVARRSQCDEGIAGATRARRSASAPRGKRNSVLPVAPPCTPTEGKSFTNGNGQGHQLWQVRVNEFHKDTKSKYSSARQGSSDTRNDGGMMIAPSQSVPGAKFLASAEGGEIRDNLFVPKLTVTRQAKSHSVSGTSAPLKPSPAESFDSKRVSGSPYEKMLEWERLIRAGVSAMTSLMPGPAAKGHAVCVGDGRRQGWFRAYHVEEFRHIRQFFGVEDPDLASMLGLQSPEFIRAGGGGAGGSGAHLWFTPGKAFVIKTMSSSEARFFQKIAKSYCESVLLDLPILLPSLDCACSLSSHVCYVI
eukprot:jgi/Bigna1/139785/aug1.52_g14493